MDSFGILKQENNQAKNSGAVIIPVASGKGGVGKTFLAANLAMALAEDGHRVIAADLDFGGANLHSFLGLSNRHPGIGDFLKARSAELVELLVPCRTPNLFFLPGDGKTPFMANMAYAQKIRLMTYIRQLPAEYILLDLGAGSSYNTLDFFRLSSNGLLVTTPEPTAIMGMLVFLKNFLLRSIERELVRHPAVRQILQDLFKRPMGEQAPSIKDVHQKIIAEDPAAGEAVSKIYQQCRPRIVINMGENPDDSKMAIKISKTLGEILSIEADYFGFVFKDSSVLASIRKRHCFLPNYHSSVAAQNMVRIAQRIVKFWHQPIKDSAVLLLNHVKRDCEIRQRSPHAT
ncbi:MAG: P-loop NTPase [Desulfobacterales bacterium]|nr:MAG: P-loop NTPase [Desulfobacterales bacterium]